MLSGAQKHVNCFDQSIKCFCEIFLIWDGQPFFSVNVNHDLMVGINYKINVVMHYYLSCAYPQHGGDERVITRKCNEYWLLFQDNNETALSILVINVNFSITATCVLYLSWLINWTSPRMDIIVAIHVTKLLTKNFSLNAYGVRYFLGQCMWPFKLYQFFDEINQ